MLCGLRQRAGIAVGPAYPDFCEGVAVGSRAGTGITSGDAGIGTGSAATGGTGGIHGSGSKNSSGLRESDLEDAVSSMREWQFLAFSLGAVVFFGCAALVAWYVANCIKRDHYEPPTGKIALTTLRSKHTSKKIRNHRGGTGVLASVREDGFQGEQQQQQLEEEEEEEEEEEHSDDDRVGLLDA